MSKSIYDETYRELIDALKAAWKNAGVTALAYVLRRNKEQA